MNVLNKLPKAVPAVVRICVKPDLSAAEQRQVLYVLFELTRRSFKEPAAVQAWWQESGEAEYAKLLAPAPAPDKPAPQKKPGP